MAAPADAEPPSFQTIDGQSDVVFTDRRPAGAAAAHARGAAAAASRTRAADRRRPHADVAPRPRPRSIPPSTRWRRPCWCRTPARSKTWCGRCCGRCSSPGSTTICRAWSSASSRPRSNASRAAAGAHAPCSASRARHRAPPAETHERFPWHAVDSAGGGGLCTAPPDSEANRQCKSASKSTMIDKTYQPSEVEGRIYAEWEQAGAFRAGRPERAARQPYSIVIPPPNVTGSLHMGHALNNTLQDILAASSACAAGRAVAARHRPRRHRDADGGRAAVDGAAGARPPRHGPREIPGAGLGLEGGIRRHHHSASSSGSARPATGRASASPWTRACRAPCIKVFVALYNEGLIYKDKRLVNWDPKLLTAISDLEVQQVEVKGHLWHIKYPIEGSDEFIVVATTRPETMLGDVAVAVHPENEKLKHLIGKTRDPAAGRPPHSDRRRRLRRSGEGHRRGEDHAGARLQRLRGRQAAQSAAGQRARRRRQARRSRTTRRSSTACRVHAELDETIEAARRRPLQGAQGDRRAAGERRASSTRSSRTRTWCRTATAPTW